MKKALASVLCATLLSGCLNLYTRCPGTVARVENCYQSTRTAFSCSVIVAFPQMMSCTPDTGLHWMNAMTIPLGLVGMCDCACEAVLDTVFLPVDYPISCFREKKGE